jgi:ABC-type multidrug transport system permease subunit
LKVSLWIERSVVFFKRELKLRVSYRMTLFTSVISGVSGLVVYGLLGNSASGSVTTQAYNMTLGSYLVSGVAFSPIIMAGLAMFSQHSSPSELEEVMVTPTGFRDYLLSSSVFDILVTLGSSGFFFGTAVLLLGLNYSFNTPLLALVILLGLLCSIGLGFIGLGMRLIYKQSSLVSWVVFSLTGLVGNIIVPVQILPTILQSISYLTPQYYFFTSLRVALGSGNPPVGPLVALFIAYTIVLLAVGVLVLDRGLRFIRRNGTHRWV